MNLVKYMPPFMNRYGTYMQWPVVVVATVIVIVLDQFASK